MRFPVAAKMALAKCWGSGGNAGLAAPAGRFGAGHDMDFDFARRVAHAQDLVVVKIALPTRPLETVISLFRACAKPKLMALPFGLSH